MMLFAESCAAVVTMTMTWALLCGRREDRRDDRRSRVEVVGENGLDDEDGVCDYALDVVSNEV